MIPYNFKGILQVDSDNGIVYFLLENGVTILRIDGLPKPLKIGTAKLLDISYDSHMVREESREAVDPERDDDE